jgi:exopolysaccharide biosynthesis polyprenyl glycosylphosphotransferase
VNKDARAAEHRAGGAGQLARRRPAPTERFGRRRPKVGADISPVWEDISPQPGHPEAVESSLARDAFFRRALAIADVSGAYIALLFAVLVLARGSIDFRPAIALVGPFVVLISKAIGLYDRDQSTLRKNTLDELPSILYLAISYALVTWLAEAVLLRGWLGRPEVFGLALGAFILIVVGRVLARHVALTFTPTERCVVLGSAADADRTAEKLAGSPRVKASVVGRVSLTSHDNGHRSGHEVPGEARALVAAINDLDAERVIIAPSGHDQEEVLHAIRVLKAIGVKVSVVPRLLEVVGSSSTFDEVDGLTLLGVRQYGLAKSSEFLKRSMDLAGATCALFLLGPVLIVIAIAVKLDSRGPVFFRQPRIGRRGQRFDMVKFRSMVRDADRAKDQLRKRNEAGGGLFKVSDDPRVTRVGRFLRRSSLDELPQLMNVVMGHMSLVGPRPLVPDEDALIEGWQRRRLAVRPGMTGLWQIFGSFRIPMQEMVKIDYMYGANWSIWLDVKILLRTIPYVLRRRGL